MSTPTASTPTATKPAPSPSPRIFRQAMQNGDFRRITGTKKTTIPWVGNDFSRVLVSKNRLLTTYAGATGGKTGYTSDAGRCLVFSAEREGMELIGVVLSCPNWLKRRSACWTGALKTTIRKRRSLPVKPPARRPWRAAVADAVTAVAEGDLAAAVGEGEDMARGVRLPRRCARACRKRGSDRHGDANI